MTFGNDRYNYQGTVGSQPNYPSSYNEGKVGKKPKYDNSYNKGKKGNQNPYPGMPPGGYGRAPGGLEDFGNMNPGLHTEFIEDEGIDERSYGTQDVVFYLMRADADSPTGPSGNPSVEGPGSFTLPPPIDPGGYSGPSESQGKMQSGANQIALGRIANELGEVTGGPMAPMSGFEYEDEEPLGRWSQNAAFNVNVATAVRNALRTVPGLGSDVVVKGLASSERLFSRMLLNGFEPNNDLGQHRTADQILETLDRATTSELAYQLARETDGLLRSKDVVQAINKGELGAVTSKSRAYQERMSTTGRVSKV